MNGHACMQVHTRDPGSDWQPGHLYYYLFPSSWCRKNQFHFFVVQRAFISWIQINWKCSSTGDLVAIIFFLQYIMYELDDPAHHFPHLALVINSDPSSVWSPIVSPTSQPQWEHESNSYKNILRSSDYSALGPSTDRQTDKHRNWTHFQHILLFSRFFSPYLVTDYLILRWSNSDCQDRNEIKVSL